MLVFLCDPLDSDNEEEYRNDDNQDNNDLPEHDDDGVDDEDDDDDDDQPEPPYLGEATSWSCSAIGLHCEAKHRCTENDKHFERESLICY